MTLPVNRGKGAALKAGLAHVAATRPGAPVVCADADGQHALDDIVAVGERLLAEPDGARLVLGTRTFDGRVPLRSRVGNTVTRWLFTAATRTPGHRHPDRPARHPGRPAGVGVHGAGREVRVRAAGPAAGGPGGHRARPGADRHDLPRRTTPPPTSGPSLDSLRVYAPLLAFLASSLAAFADRHGRAARPAGADGRPAARRRRRPPDQRRGQLRGEPAAGLRRASTASAPAARCGRYALLATALLGLNYLLLSGLSGAGVALLPAKVLTELALVPTSFAAQRGFVFRAPAPLRRLHRRRTRAAHLPDSRADHHRHHQPLTRLSETPSKGRTHATSLHLHPAPPGPRRHRRPSSSSPAAARPWPPTRPRPSSSTSGLDATVATQRRHHRRRRPRRRRRRRDRRHVLRRGRRHRRHPRPARSADSDSDAVTVEDGTVTISAAGHLRPQRRPRPARSSSTAPATASYASCSTTRPSPPGRPPRSTWSTPSRSSSCSPTAATTRWPTRRRTPTPPRTRRPARSTPPPTSPSAAPARSR